ncbi:MAG: LEA type 2 family protein [Gammaproteobacteria bacterium]|jgi:LEA14-like dessication related protein
MSSLKRKTPAVFTAALRFLPWRIFCMLALACGLNACATLQGDYDPPTVSVASFRAVPGGGAAPSFEIGLRVVNPNSEALELQGVAYTISLDGREVMTGVGKDLPVVAGYSEETFTVTASASMLQTFQLLRDLMTEPKSSVSYELETKLDVGTFRPAIRVKDSGEISLQPAR